jgi:hypothetical protein
MSEKMMEQSHRANTEDTPPFDIVTLLPSKRLTIELSNLPKTFQFDRLSSLKTDPITKKRPGAKALSRSGDPTRNT